MKKILIDTGFWYALLEPRDGHHALANDIFEQLEYFELLLPWPSLYETLNTRFTKRKDHLVQFMSIIQSDNVRLIEDLQYKENALTKLKEHDKYRVFALVDNVIREMLMDMGLQIHYLLTFNTGDFIDLCSKRKVSLIDNYSQNYV